ncbi:MAG: hypothetical protein NZ521_05520 [Flammeovirgaceae bacterium]|nr:hypothetical protein [Flammeovirgaceae bacterium]MDW8287704.1 hypothetical protein [Flammeovirgaceae bacterium]
MNSPLAPTFYELIHEVTLIALNHASAAMSQALKDDVFIKTLEEYPVLSPEENQERKQCYVLHTEMQGDFTADTFILVSEISEAKIAEKLLPPDLLGQWEMREASLLELDNMVIAALVTIYANLLKTKVFGQVPSLSRCPSDELLKKFHKKDNASPYSFRAKLIAFHSRITMEIIVIFNASLLKVLENSRKQTSSEKIEHKENFVKGFFRKLFH